MLNAELSKLTKTYSKENGLEFEESALIYEDERTELLLYFNAYLTSLDVPKLNDTIFNIEDFQKNENGLYILKLKGENFLMTYEDLEVHIKKI